MRGSFVDELVTDGDGFGVVFQSGADGCERFQVGPAECPLQLVESLICDGHGGLLDRKFRDLRAQALFAFGCAVHQGTNFAVSATLEVLGRVVVLGEKSDLEAI